MRISGQIFSLDGRGIGGSHVFAYHQIGSPGQSQLEKLINIVEVQKFAGQPPAEAVSAEDGSYQIDGLERKFYSVKAIAGGFSPMEKENILPTKEGVDFNLPPGGEITGTVVDSSTNEGIEGAKVSAYSHVEGGDIFAIIQTRSRPPLETVAAGPGGQFKIETLGSGVYNIVVNAKGYQEGKFLKIKVQPGQASQQRFAIGRGLSIAGTVLSPSNDPVAGAKVRVTRI